jgi:hypothetical protein
VATYGNQTPKHKNSRQAVNKLPSLTQPNALTKTAGDLISKT